MKFFIERGIMRLQILLALLVVGLCFAQAPAYQPYYYQECAGVAIDVGYYGAPCVADWDGDGVKDMVLGIFTGGNIRFYANENTNDSPVFTSYTNIQADGSSITLPSG